LAVGYDIEITRKPRRADRHLEGISLQEWLDFVERDPAYRLKDPSEGFVETGEALYTQHSSGDEMWFVWFQGDNTTRGADDELILEMGRVAKLLNAIVLDQYDQIFDGLEITEFEDDSPPDPKDPWWITVLSVPGVAWMLFRMWLQSFR
jgi:hypothetical protein